MTPEEKSLLERTYKLTEENNGILRGIRRSNRFSMLLHALYWVVIIILSFGAYYLIQPYVTTMLSLLGSSSANSSSNGLDMNAVQNAAKQLQGLLK